MGSMVSLNVPVYFCNPSDGLQSSTEAVGTLPTPSIVASESIEPAGATSTSTGTFPTFSALSTSLTTASPAKTVASAISLSNGLGPLLSSSSRSSTSSTGMLGTGTIGSSDIQVLSATLAPTAAPSSLTTSGIPGSLSVDLSSVSLVPARESSVALISFGSSSPAIFSTVMPPGYSMGTSSVILTTYPTIALSRAALTGVTLMAPRSPTSCFTLPTPAASMDLIAVAIVPEGDYDLSNPMIFGLGDNGTTPQYVSAMAAGNPYVLNLSPDNPVTGQLGLQIPGDTALVFDGSGMSLYTGNCSALTQVVIDNFYQQLGAVPATQRRLAKRQAPSTSTFNVNIAVDSFLNTASFKPNLTFGNSPCTYGASSPSSFSMVNVTWTCVYPPPGGGTAECAAGFTSWMDDMSGPSSSPKNTTQVLAALGPFLSLAGDSITNLFPGSDPALGLGFTFMRQVESAAAQAVGSVGSSACEVLHAFDSDDLVIADKGPLGTQTVGSFMTAPPPSVVVNLAAAATQAIVALPPRKANPTDNFLKQIATDFKSIFGAFTHWLGGLPLFHHATPTPTIPSIPGVPSIPAIPSIGGIPGLGGIPGIPGLDETGITPPGMPAMTITSSASLITSSAANAPIPTVTVTHVLGDGWFSPSTYVVGPGTSTVPLFPVLELPIEASGSISTGTTYVSLEEYVDYEVQSSSHGAAAGVEAGHRWDLPNRASQEPGTTTRGESLGYDGHVVVITTTVTLTTDNQHI